jgi:hypothetical protein
LTFVSLSFIFPQYDELHVGSLDIDVALDFSKIPDDTYQTILKAFLKRGYTQDKEQPFRFFRKVKIEGAAPISVEVDLMAGEYGGTGKGHRTQKVQDIRARKARGCDLAFDSSITVTLEGELPGGGKDKVSFKVAGIVPLLVMKGMAMFERIRSKFVSIEHIGPKWMADFLEVTEKEDRDIIMRRVYEKVSKLLDILGISSWEVK